MGNKNIEKKIKRNNNNRSINVNDAISYLDEVKQQYKDTPQVYSDFLDIMKNFNSQRLSTSDVIDRVLNLFKDKPNLIVGFNAFLPLGYSISLNNNQLPGYSISLNNNHKKNKQCQRISDNYNRNNNRSINVRDALSYLDEVKQQYKDTPQVYSDFLDIMKNFKSQRLSTSGVIDRVLNLFKDKPNLIVGFNTFLSPGYSISLNNNQPPGYSISLNNNHKKNKQYENCQRISENYNHANNFINKIKNRFISEPSKYRKFMEILQIHQKKQNSIQEVYSQIKILFQNQQDLLEELNNFLPDIISPNTNNHRDIQHDNCQNDHENFSYATNFVNQVKNRYISEPGNYKKFLEILLTYEKEQKSIQEVYSQIKILFQNEQDLLEEFKNFIPNSIKNNI